MSSMTFDEMLDKNIPEFPGLAPVNSGVWYSILSDLSTSLYEWKSSIISDYDLLLIERYIMEKKKFAILYPKFKIGNAIVRSTQLRVLRVLPLNRGDRNRVTTVQIVLDKPPKNIVYNYNFDDFVYFEDLTLSQPIVLIRKYSEILAKLDALYMQNVEKLGLPVIALTDKQNKNDLLNLFKRSMMNALFCFFSSKNYKSTETFFNPQIEFILDKINSERESIMKEFLQELGVNPNDDIQKSTHYVNNSAIRESSLISKYFSAVMNKYRDNFVLRVNQRFDPSFTYQPTVQIESEVSDNGQINQSDFDDN